MPKGLLQTAVRNNAEWCELVARSHGVSNQWLESAWRATEPMPPFYPNVVSVEAGMQPDNVSKLAEDLPVACGWKDSFANLELGEFNFTVKFEANWYALSELLSGNAVTKGSVDTVTSSEGLKEWIAAWGETPNEQSVFPAKLMGPNVRFIYRRSAGIIDAGLIANLSSDAVGITNTFGHFSGIEQCICVAFEMAEGLPLVGYGSDDDLQILGGLGFKGLGKLKVWVR